MKYVLGVDGGGTKTLARLCRISEGGQLESVGEGRAVGSNPLSVGWDAAQQNLHEAITTATSDTPVDAAVLAVAGCASGDARDQLQQWADQQGFAQRLRVVPDTEPLLADIPSGTAAIGLIAGTGSAAVLRYPDGKSELLGGWGYLIGDGGSGYAIGQAALRLLANYHDSRAAEVSFARKLLDRLGLQDASELRTKLYRAEDPRAWVARLAPTVIEAANAGDGHANVIVTYAAGELGQLVFDATERMGSDRRPLIRLAGALLTDSTAYRARVIEDLTTNGGWDDTLIEDAPEAALACARMAAAML